MNIEFKKLILIFIARKDAERAKTLLACCLYYTGIAWLFSFASRGGYIIIYHSVGGEDVYWDNVMRTESFRKQVQWLKKHKRIVQVQDFVDRINRNVPVPDDWVALTFDDGYLDNLSNALPILELMEAPASFYITWDILCGRQEFFYDRIQTSVSRTKKKSIQVMLGDSAFRGPTTTRHQKLKCIQEIVLKIRNMCEEKRAKCVKSVEAACLNSEPVMHPPYLDESTLGVLSGSPLAKIGSHTLSHPDLARCAPRLMYRELKQSRGNLSKMTGDRIEGLAYPFGKASNYNEGVLRQCAEVGYRFALTTTYGSVQRDSDPFQLPRVGARDSLVRLKVNLMGISI